MSKKSNVERLIDGSSKSWSDATALEVCEMIMYQPVFTDNACGLRVSRAVHGDCGRSLSII